MDRGRIRVKGPRGGQRRHLVLTMFVLARRRAKASRTPNARYSGLGLLNFDVQKKLGIKITV